MQFGVVCFKNRNVIKFLVGAGLFFSLVEFGLRVVVWLWVSAAGVNPREITPDNVHWTVITARVLKTNISEL